VLVEGALGLLVLLANHLIRGTVDERHMEIARQAVALLSVLMSSRP
jgi:hypothetical protein